MNPIWFKRRRITIEAKDDPILFVVIIILAAGILGGLGVLGYQIYGYLRVGEWQPLSVITGLRWLGLRWAFEPREWLGVYKILNVIPLSFGVSLCDLVPMFISILFEE